MTKCLNTPRHYDTINPWYRRWKLWDRRLRRSTFSALTLKIRSHPRGFSLCLWYRRWPWWYRRCSNQATARTSTGFAGLRLFTNIDSRICRRNPRWEASSPFANGCYGLLLLTPGEVSSEPPKNIPDTITSGNRRFGPSKVRNDIFWKIRMHCDSHMARRTLN